MQATAMDTGPKRPSKNIRLIALDLDGTALNTKKEITPGVAEAIKEAIKSGIQVLPATGRMWVGIPPEFLAIPGVRYAICCNGATVYDLYERCVLFSDSLTHPKAAAFLRILDGFDCSAAVYMGDEAFVAPVRYDDYAAIFSPQFLHYAKTIRQEVDDLYGLLREKDRPVEKLSVLFKTYKERDRAWQIFEGRDDCTLTSSSPGNLELNTPTANKGTAVLRLGELLGLGRRQIMAVGDGVNDMHMLRAAGWAVAMANAQPQVLALADTVTTSCDEDGVALAIRAVTR